MENTNYIGDKVIYAELSSHKYYHVAAVDGDKLYISDSGEVRIDTGISRQWNQSKGEMETIRTYDTPALWNFAPKELDAGVYEKGHGCLPKLYANVDGALSTSDEDCDY